MRIINNGNRAISFVRNENAIIWDLNEGKKIGVLEEPDVVMGNVSEDGNLIILGRNLALFWS